MSSNDWQHARESRHNPYGENVENMGLRSFADGCRVVIEEKGCRNGNRMTLRRSSTFREWIGLPSALYEVLEDAKIKGVAGMVGAGRDGGISRRRGEG
jgi:hypothetical protein